VKDETARGRSTIRVSYYPWCPWVAPVLVNLREIAEDLSLDYVEVDLFQRPSSAHRAVLLVEADGKEIPIHVGMSDSDHTRRMVEASIEGKPMPESGVEEAEQPARGRQVSVGRVESVPIQRLNISDVVGMCISEDFMYGPIPDTFADKAKEMRREWLEGLVDRFGFAGTIAYGNGKAVGFMETVPGRLSESMGMPTSNPREETWVILCLSITKNCWGQGIASMLVERTIDHLKESVQWIEVGAHKKGYWHPADFYSRCGFSVTKDVGDICVMSRII